MEKIDARLNRLLVDFMPRQRIDKTGEVATADGLSEVFSIFNINNGVLLTVPDKQRTLRQAFFFPGNVIRRNPMQAGCQRAGRWGMDLAYCLGKIAI